MLNELKSKGGHLKIKELNTWKQHFDLWPKISQLVGTLDLAKVDSSTGTITLTEKGIKFKSFETQRNSASNDLEKEQLTMQQLRTQVQLLTDQLADFPRMKRQRRNAIIVSIFAIAIAVILGLLQYLKK